MSRFLVEGIGFNDGSPFTEFESDDLNEAREQLDIKAREEPRITHRLIEVIHVQEATERVYL